MRILCVDPSYPPRGGDPTAQGERGGGNGDSVESHFARQNTADGPLPRTRHNIPPENEPSAAARQGGGYDGPPQSQGPAYPDQQGGGYGGPPQGGGGYGRPPQDEYNQRGGRDGGYSSMVGTGVDMRRASFCGKLVSEKYHVCVSPRLSLCAHLCAY